jgi:hypothetical protein
VHRRLSLGFALIPCSPTFLFNDIAVEPLAKQYLHFLT